MATVKTSVLSKFQKKYHNIAIKDSWIEFSIDTPEFAILESLVQEQDGQIVLPVLKRNGVNPAETVEIACYEEFKALETGFWEYVDEVARKTKLSRFEVIYKMPEDLDGLLAKIQEEAAKLEGVEGDDDLTRKKREKIEADIQAIQEQVTQKNTEISEKTAEYTDEVNAKYAAYQAKMYDYQIELASLRSGIPVENIKNLHPEFLQQLGAFMNNEIRGVQGEDSGEKK